VTADANGIDAISPDESRVLFHKVYDSTTFTQDLYLASASAAGTPVTISATQDVGLYGDGFTSDSTHFLYFTDLDQDAAGSIQSSPVAGGSPTALTTNKGWVVFAGAAGKVVFNDNWTAQSSGSSRADLQWVDQAGGTAKLIATQADDAPSLNQAGDKVIYTYHFETAKAGLYAAPLQ
jgi:hypothetical protein